MSSEASGASAAPQENVFWCNVCDFRTTNRAAYLAHSCAEVLRVRKEREVKGSD